MSLTNTAKEPLTPAGEIAAFRCVIPQPMTSSRRTARLERTTRVRVVVAALVRVVDRLCNYLIWLWLIKFGCGQDHTRIFGGLRAAGDQHLSILQYGHGLTGARPIQIARS